MADVAVVPVRFEIRWSDLSTQEDVLMATATLRIGPADHGRAMTLEEYLDAEVEPGCRCELARGIIEVTNVPNDPHGEVVYHLYLALGVYDRAHPGLIRRFGGSGEFQFVLPAMVSGWNPDVAVVLQGTPKDDRGRRPASFAVEVVSEGAEARERDYITKRVEYLAYGLREYWIVDPDLRRVAILVRDGDAWIERVVEDDGLAESLVLPGFAVRLSELWAADSE
jgi:Uma2 family endonuclease